MYGYAVGATGVLAGRGPGSRSSGSVGNCWEIVGEMTEGPAVPGLLVGTDGNSGKRRDAPSSISSMEGNVWLNSEKVKCDKWGEDAVDDDGEGGPNEEGDTKEWLDEPVA